MTNEPLHTADPLHPAGPLHTADPLHTATAPDSYWTVTNLTEAFPGVLTPLGWSIIGTACEVGNRAAFHSIGALRASEMGVPARVEDRAYGCFFGRAAIRVDWLAGIADRIPGADGELVTEQFMGCVPPSMQGMVTTRRRYPVVAARFPVTLARVPGMVRRNRAATHRIWLDELGRTPELDVAGARRQVERGVRAVIDAVTVDATKLLAGVQPVYEALMKVAGAAGVETAALESGHGSHEETELVEDLWSYSRGRLEFAEVLARHGFHGPREGEVSSRVWREEPGPLLRIAESYRDLPDGSDPVTAQARRSEARIQAERELLTALRPHQRPAARAVLALSHRYLPLRGKAARLQGLDVARAGARRLGELLADAGELEQPDDVFFLTADEIAAPPAEPRELVAQRRAHWESHHPKHPPVHWEGDPRPVEQPAGGVDDEPKIAGLGASAGVVEGRVCVVTDPSFARDDIRAGDVLVAHTTDPSWASIMFASAALVVDIGGMLSHAAVVARELGIPCVMGTGTGTRVLRTGDRVRVDGSTGQVEVLGRF